MSGNSTDERLTHLQNAILRAFPDVVFDGPITHHDNEWPDDIPENRIYEGQVLYGDEMFLYQELKGHKWSEVSREFIQGMATEYVLLTSEALVAYIAAWLMHSLENLTGENQVRDLFIYMFTPRDEQKDFIISLFRAFNPEQLVVLRLLLVEFSETVSSDYVREYALNGVKFTEGLCAGRK